MAKTVRRDDVEIICGNVYIGEDLYGTEEEYYNDLEAGKIVLID